MLMKFGGDADLDFIYKPLKRPMNQFSSSTLSEQGSKSDHLFEKLLSMYPEEKRTLNISFMKLQWNYWIQKGIKPQSILIGLHYLIWKYKHVFRNRKGDKFSKSLPVEYWIELWIFLRDELWIKEKSDRVQAFPIGEWSYDKIHLLTTLQK